MFICLFESSFKRENRKPANQGGIMLAVRFGASFVSPFPRQKRKLRHWGKFRKCSFVAFRPLLSVLLLIALGCSGTGFGDDAPDKSVEQARLETMRDRIIEISVQSREPGFPDKMVDQPLFRYDDLTRGYIDGTVWRLGASGRPKAIITSELHPKYDGSPRIVYDYLSLSETPFSARMAEGAVWSPPGSAVEMKSLSDGPQLAGTKAQRLFQLKKMSERFTGHQTVEGQDLELRLLPRPIDRYQPADGDECDAAVFLFVSGRNPGIILLIESTGSNWQYGVGRLSEPSLLRVELDGNTVWNVDRATLGWSMPYTATNFHVDIPGIKSQQRVTSDN